MSKKTKKHDAGAGHVVHCDERASRQSVAEIIPEPKPKTPHITVKRPRCPHCQSLEIEPYKRVKHDGFAVHYCKCRACDKNVNLDIY